MFRKKLNLEEHQLSQQKVRGPKAFETSIKCLLFGVLQSYPFSTQMDIKTSMSYEAFIFALVLSIFKLTVFFNFF